jgi:hypothetical protein
MENSENVITNANLSISTNYRLLIIKIKSNIIITYFPLFRVLLNFINKCWGVLYLSFPPHPPVSIYDCTFRYFGSIIYSIVFSMYNKLIIIGAKKNLIGRSLHRGLWLSLLGIILWCLCSVGNLLFRKKNLSSNFNFVFLQR